MLQLNYELKMFAANNVDLRRGVGRRLYDLSSERRKNNTNLHLTNIIIIFSLF